MRHAYGWTLIAGLALLVGACGGSSDTAATVDKSSAADKGVTDKTGSGATSNNVTKTGSSSTTTKSAPGTKKLNGSVCSLLTPAEVEAVLKTGQTLTSVETADPDSDRTCNYVMSGMIPILGVSLQGELEPVDWGSVKAIPGATTVSLRGGAEGAYVPLTAVFYVHKNGLAVVMLPVAVPSGETNQTVGQKLAQSVADRLP